MKILSNLFIIFFSITSIFAQDTTKVIVDRNFRFNQGLFISFEQVKENAPIPISNIITPVNKNSIDFFNQILNYKYIVFIDKNGQQRQINSKDVWGYSLRGRLYILWGDKPAMIPILGTISHFIASHVEYDYSSNYDPYSYYYSEPTKREENKQYILFFPTGQVLEFNYINMTPIFSTDQEIYQQWNNLSRRKKKKLIFVYLRKFNQKHPLMLPQNK